MSAVRFSLLGPVRARRGDTDLDLGGRQQRLVLALLLARAGSVAGLGEMVDLVWADDPPASAVNVLHRHIGTLRRLIEPDLPVRASGGRLVRHAAGYQLKVDEHDLDLLRFRRLVARARTAPDPAAAVRCYLEALSLWEGPCAAGLGSGTPAFVAIDAERSRALRDAADAAMSAGDVPIMLPVLRQAAGWAPLDEPLQARLIAALAADGRQAEAMETYQEVRRRLADELGIVPGRELTETYARLLHQNSGATRPPGPSPAAQLPPDLPHFRGRDDVLARAEALIGQGRPAAALAVDGMPGVGKTTLAVHLAHRLTGAYPDAQLYADLRGFAAKDAAMSPEEALRGFLGALGVPAQTLPGELHALAGLYRSMLAGRRALVVLDNARDYEQVRHLLPAGPGNLAIVTSRVRLTGLITSGAAHPLPLDLPSPAEARDELIARLGAERATAEPAAVDEIIDRCGRLPLALALAAARAKALPGTPLAEIAAGLDGDLSTVFSWSYRALSPAAARLFRLLPLHPGPDFTAATAARLAGIDPRTARALLAELSGHMLLQARTGRYQVHDLLRAYATELSSRFVDTGRRAAGLRGSGIHYAGLGIAGGAETIERWPADS